jgi:molecular chaperone GrpE
MNQSSKQPEQESDHPELEIVSDEAASEDAPKGPPPLPLSEGEQLQAALKECDENKDHWLRTQAELDNFRKRVKKEADQNRLYQSLPLVRDLLPGLDNLDRAMTAAENSDSLEGLLAGVRMVFKHFEETLGRYSVKPIAAVGEPFDPNLHEAVQQIPTADHPPMTVMQEVERGFQLHDRVIRPSKVIVSAALPEPADGE